MELVLDILSWIFLMGGAAFTLIGAVGVVRFPDVFTRMHGAGMIDTLGVGLIFLGLMIQAGVTLVTAKLLLIIAFILFTSPTTTHALARAIINAGVEPQLDVDENRAESEGGPSSKT